MLDDVGRRDDLQDQCGIGRDESRESTISRTCQ